MPYQCLAKCGKVLIAARGSSIDSFNLEDGSLLSTWKCLATQKSKTSEQVVSNRLVETPELTASSEDVVLHSSSPPAKRRKLFATGEDATPNSSEKQGKKKDAAAAAAAVVGGLEAAPAVIALTVTANGQHVIAVTEDKSIRVFENLIEGNGKQSLKQLSQRSVLFRCGAKCVC
jgi:tRNA (guanine-N(7)-)-methyltransferase subunit TRM82